MIARPRVILFSALIFFGLFPHLASAEKIETVTVFTTSFMTIEKTTENVSVTQYFLDDPDLVLHELSKNLPGTLDEAMPYATRLINTPEGSKLIQKLESGFDGVVKAWSLKIKYLPAIVINERYLVYGIYSVDEALSLYKDRML